MAFSVEDGAQLTVSLIISHTCVMGFISGQYGGHAKILIPTDWRNSIVLRVKCGRTMPW